MTTGGAKQTRGHLFGGCWHFCNEFWILVTEVNLICREKNRDKWKERNVRQLIEDEGYELALIAYMKQTGIGYWVDPEEEEDPEEGEDPPGNLRRYPEDIPVGVV